MPMSLLHPGENSHLSVLSLGNGKVSSRGGLLMGLGEAEEGTAARRTETGKSLDSLKRQRQRN